MTLTKTTTTNKMPTTAVNASANANDQKKQPKMIAKWSGSDEPQSYYDHEDDDTATLTRHEANYIRWYNTYDHSKWRNADDEEEYEECTHVPFMNLTKEQRAEKSKNFKFGLCCDCDAGLDDKSDFVRETRLSGDVKMCNACHNYHMDVFERNVGGEHGGCN